MDRSRIEQERMVAARRKRARNGATTGRDARREDERSIPIQRAGNARLSPAFVIIGQHGRSERIEITHGATRGRRLARDRIRLPPAPRLPSVRACEHDTPRPCKHDGQNGDDHPAKLVPTGDHCKHLITTWADDATTGRSERPLSYANSPHSVQSKIESGQLSPAPPFGCGVQTMFDPGSQGGYDNVD